MKKLYLLIHFICFSIFGLHAQSKNNKKKWDKDAQQLTARMAKKQGINGAPQLSLGTITDLSAALEAVATSDVPNAHFVTEDLDIHAASLVNVNEVDLLIDVHVEWAQAWWNGKEDLLPESLRALMAKYNLKMDRISENAGMYCFALISEEALNMTYLAYELSDVEDVLMTTIPNSKATTSDIEAKQVSGGWLLTYVYRFGSCSSSCTQEHAWQFGVDYAGNVTFVTDYGAALPDEVGQVQDLVAEELEQK